MPLYVKSPEVDCLAERLAAARGVTKTKAVRDALAEALHRMPANAGPPSKVIQEVMKLVDDFHARAGPNRQPVDKAWIDSLYEDD